ncbi:MAG: DNA alkylation repair protein [Candidatus Melainabacteria bacterium HGW-Melainabacteria-1]|nr:MAG: DNA alkylation repair protein [Candidatus Melainabacteria bacterium HGW-Melainabacteria-1]
MKTQDLLKELEALADPQQARQLMRFFRTGPGQYGEGDRFLGIKVPVQRALAKKYRHLPLSTLSSLLESPWHESRLTGLLIVKDHYQRGDEATRRECFNTLLSHFSAFNNWDLIDVIVPGTLGDYLYRHQDERYRLQTWIRSDRLWERRIALLASLAFIRQGQFEVPLQLCTEVLHDCEDLIHKASGWMLREAGKRNQKVLLDFLESHAATMPRTMLRYAIEKLLPQQRSDYMACRAKT